MTSFEYKGYDTEGRLRRGLVEAEGPKDARGRLAAQGILCDWVRPAAGNAARRAVRPAAFAAGVRILVYRELAALLESGVALVPALEIVMDSPELDQTRILLAAVRDGVREGKPLSVALGEASPRVTAFERAIVEAGERTGGMGRALERMSGFLDEQERLAEKLRGALAYPCVVVSLAVLLGAGVLLFLLPAMQRVLEGADLPVPLVTRLMLGGGRIVGALLALAAAGGAAAAVAARRRFRTDAAFRVRADRRLYSVPLAGRSWRELASLRFVRVLSLLLERGVGLVEAVPLAGRASGSAWLADCAVREAAALAQGKPLVDVVRGIRPLHPSLAAWVRAGETGGNLAELLDTAAGRLQRAWERRTARGMMFVELALTLGVGIVVTFIALAILLPVLQMNKGFAPM